MAQTKARPKPTKPSKGGSKTATKGGGRQQRSSKALLTGKGRSFSSIAIIAILVVGGLGVVVLSAFPGVIKEEAAVYKIDAFFYNDTHTAEKEGLTQFIMYVKNSGNREDTYQISVGTNRGNFEVSFSPDNATLKPGKSTVFIVSAIASVYEGQYSAEVEIKSTGEPTKKVAVPFKVKVVNSFGNAITAEDSVGMWYFGVLTNGKLFDSNLKNVIESNYPRTDDIDKPLCKPTQNPGKDNCYQPHYDIFDMKPIGTSQVIEGWREGVPGMKLGQTLAFRFPPELAYDYDSPRKEMAGKTILFEMTVGVKYDE